MRKILGAIRLLLHDVGAFILDFERENLTALLATMCSLLARIGLEVGWKPESRRAIAVFSSEEGQPLMSSLYI